MRARGRVQGRFEQQPFRRRHRQPAFTALAGISHLDRLPRANFLFVQGVVNHSGALHRTLPRPRGHPSPGAATLRTLPRLAFGDPTPPQARQ